MTWPFRAADGDYVMDLWSDTLGKPFSGPTTVATITNVYSGPARLAMTGGSGFLTWQDSNGLELVDLSGA